MSSLVLSFNACTSIEAKQSPIESGCSDCSLRGFSQIPLIFFPSILLTEPSEFSVIRMLASCFSPVALLVAQAGAGGTSAVSAGGAASGVAGAALEAVVADGSSLPGQPATSVTSDRQDMSKSFRTIII